MGRILLICRLAVRDLRRRRAEAILLLLAITAATATLTLALVLHGVTSQPYQRTRVATAGPDVVAGIAPRALGATQGQVTAGLATAQLVSALPAAIAGMPAGIALFAAVGHAGAVTSPPVPWLIAVVLGTLLVIAGLTAIPDRIGARHPAAENLQTEVA